MQILGWRSRWLRGLLFGAWVAGLLGASAALWLYKLTPGAQAATVSSWPSESRLATTSGRPTLLLFAHPRCPCTRSSLAELREVLSRFGSRVSAQVIFVHPDGTGADWSQTEIRSEAESVPGVRVTDDPDGRETALFGARISGHVVLYSAAGRLLFAGGLTPGRGHVGANPQLARLESALESELASSPVIADEPRAAGAVYGCPLEDAP